MSALEATLEWPRFCYSTSLFDDANSNKSDVNVATTTKPTMIEAKKNRRKASPNFPAKKRRLNVVKNENDDNESTASAEDEQLVPLGPASGHNRFKPVPEIENRFKLVPDNNDNFAFSNLMRQMAKKYEANVEQEEKKISTPQILPQIGNFPIDPLILRAAFGQYFPFALPTPPQQQQQPHQQQQQQQQQQLPILPNLFQPMETLSSSQALTALAAKRRVSYDVDISVVTKRQKLDAPIDLSSTSLSFSSNVTSADDDVDIDVLSVDPEHDVEPERWSVDQVAAFVANVDSCQEYAEIFRDQSIDGSSLLELTEQHMIGILSMKLGPAIRLRNAIQNLSRSRLESSRSTLSSPNTSTSTYS